MSTQPTRRDAAAEEARQRILAATAECLVRDGLAQVRMARIAAAAGVSAGLLHYHFDTKDHLFAAVLGWTHERSAMLTREAVARAGSTPAQRLSAFLDRCLPSDERLRHDWLLWQELDVLCGRRPELARASRDLYEQLYDAATDIVHAGNASGDFDATDARATAEAAVALCDGLGARALAPGDLSLDDVQTRVRSAVARLVGHDGPLPRAWRASQGTGR